MNFAYIETKAALLLSNPLQVAARPEISKMTRQTVNPGQNGKLFGGGLYCSDVENRYFRRLLAFTFYSSYKLIGESYHVNFFPSES